MNRVLFSFVPAFLLAGIWAASLKAQSPPVPVPSPGTAGTATPENPAAGESGAEKTPETEEEKKKKARLAKIKKAKFDRRIGALLGSWAKPEGEEEEPDDKETAASPDEKPKEPVPEPDPLDEEIKQWQRDVSLSNWDGVKTFLGGLDEEESKAGFETMLKSLSATTPAVIPDLDPAIMAQVSRMRMERKQPEPNFFSIDDVFGLIHSAPAALEKTGITLLGTVLRTSLERGSLVDGFLDRLSKETEQPEEKRILSRREAAKILEAARQAGHMGRFLPPLKKAVADNDHEALNLLAVHYQAVYTKEREKKFLEDAWEVTQAVLAADGVEKEEKDRALKEAVELAPQVSEDLGELWLKESFTSKPERGMEVLRVIGSAPPDLLQTRPTDTVFRMRALQLQSTAVEALLESAPERAESWKHVLNLLANNWLREADFTRKYERSSRNSGMQRDRYGNYFYAESERPAFVPNQVRPIGSRQLLEITPGDAWMALVDEHAKPNFDRVLAQLQLKTGNDDEAFPYIEKLAGSHPELAEDLVDGFLRIWTENHDPNANRNRTSSYMFMYGYERKAEGIPLTRSKQERNLEELAEVVARLRSLPLEDLDEDLLAKAFTTCHSSAEVYRIEAIEEVFGSLDALEPKTMAALAQQMRGNLAGVWRKPAEQKKAKTNRKQKDIQGEVLRGYAVANDFVDAGLEKFPDDWSLHLAKAAIRHDENNYQQELNPDSEFSGDRRDAFEGFAKAAGLYAAGAADREEKEESTQVFDFWFYASLGACDLGMIGDRMVADGKQPARIREAIGNLPGEQSERHLKRFANALFSRMSAVKPAVKYHYLKAGFEIAGDHEAAKEARDLFDYYRDLVTEIKLETVIDGSDVVGHDSPFGVFVNLRHTREIERESGGFGRYLQNQNQGRSYYYNYGRPLENYRDKFEEIVAQSLGEKFDIQSVTFQTEEVNSRAVEPYGWRVTPYAYLLLKAKGPEADQIPGVRLDLDFLDTSGYAVLPVESPIVPIDARPVRGEPRPIRKLQITQTLDERQAEEGKLVLEIKATGQGIVPELDRILELTPGEFDIVESADQGLSVSRFDPESEDSVVISERSWMVAMQAKSGLPERPDAFHFGKPVIEASEMVYQRFVDADLESVGSELALEQEYGTPDRTWLWLVAGAVIFLILIAAKARRFFRRTEQAEEARFRMPDPVTPFTVIGLLKDIHANDGFDENGKAKLESVIGGLERFYFSEEEDGDRDEKEPDLAGIAEQWIQPGAGV